MKYLTKKPIILFTSMFMIFIIFHNIFVKKKEEFSLNDIDNMFDDVKKVTGIVKDIPDKIDNINDKLTQRVNQMGQAIENKTEKMGQIIQKNTIDFVTNKLKNIFIDIGNIFNEGIVKPILGVFIGIGNIFTQVFNILKEIGNKIVSLPNCIFTYAIKSTIDTLHLLYKRLTPNFLENIISSIYYYTLRYVFNFIGYITGYDDKVQKCYGFNVSSEVDKMKKNLNNIQSSFKNDFGRLDFSKINF
jgi:hypothetical protein